MSKPYTITTAISYPNGRPHIGHAYEVIATDAIARFQRMMGRDVFFQTGTDEHGLKMAQTARNRGIEPRELADEMSGYFKAMNDGLNISYDRFIRTSEPDHHSASQAIWQAMEANGDLYLGRYEGWYSVRDEAFYDEKELTEGEGGQKLSPRARRSNGRSRKAGSSACPPISRSCWTFTPASRISSSPTAAAMRSCALSRAAFRTSASRGPVSTGA